MEVIVRDEGQANWTICASKSITEFNGRMLGIKDWAPNPSFLTTRKIDATSLLVTLCLVNDNLEECLLLLLRTAYQSKIPLLTLVFKEIAENLRNYMKVRSHEEKEASAKELVKAYLKLWYYTKNM